MGAGSQPTHTGSTQKLDVFLCQKILFVLIPGTADNTEVTEFVSLGI